MNGGIGALERPRVSGPSAVLGHEAPGVIRASVPVIGNGE